MLSFTKEVECSKKHTIIIIDDYDATPVVSHTHYYTNAR